MLLADKSLRIFIHAVGYYFNNILYFRAHKPDEGF